jgi:hypothetical protein
MTEIKTPRDLFEIIEDLCDEYGKEKVLITIKEIVNFMEKER